LVLVVYCSVLRYIRYNMSNSAVFSIVKHY